MKQGVGPAICAMLLLLSSAIDGQTAAPDEMYIDYMKLFGGLRTQLLSKSGPVPKTVELLQNSSASLADEAPPSGRAISTVRGGRSVLTDEDIYAKRKNSVFIIGKIRKANDSTGEISFDLTGTAFAIAATGICVTNYHVLQDIIRKDTVKENRDSAYFISTFDSKLYFIDEILAYSQNNDIAVFRVDTKDDLLKPLALGLPAKVGTAVYCISHPLGYFYYYSKGIVARNVSVGRQQAAAGYNPLGMPPIRMEITADYAIGSSGGPILDKHGNLVGIVSSTAPITAGSADENGNTVFQQQMVIKDAVPLKALTELLRIGNKN